MSIDPPISPQEALYQALLETSNICRRLPAAKAGELLDVFDRIEEIWTKQSKEQFPFSTLIGEIDTIKTTLRETYGGELDLLIDQRSQVFKQVIEIDLRIRIYSELTAFNLVYSGLEKRLQRLEEVLPPRNYALRELLDDLRPSFDLNLKQRLETALRHFGSGQYELTLAECGKAEGILFARFKTFLSNLKIDGLPTETGRAIRKLQKEFVDSHMDVHGLLVFKSARLEFLVLSMFQMLHYFRNLGAHDRAEEIADENLPKWQVQRREYFTQRPEYARLALVLTLQIALELQALLEH